MRLTPLLNLLALATLTACATKTQQRAEENAAAQKQAAQEMQRICALPQHERQAELDRINKESGIVVHCGKQ